MTTVTQKTDLVGEAQGNLIEQFRDQPNIEAVLEALVTQCQGIEDVGFEIITETVISTAVGAQLDGLGDLVGIERGGSNDNEFRTRIHAQILVNKSNGTISELLEIIVLLGGTSIVLSEVPPAKIEIIVNGILTGGITAATAANEARAAGVGLGFTWHISTNPFTFDTAGKGFDQGELAEHLYF
jgi:hypothetical protein